MDVVLSEYFVVRSSILDGRRSVGAIVLCSTE